jgi:hypothetical protein
MTGSGTRQRRLVHVESQWCAAIVRCVFGQSKTRWLKKPARFQFLPSGAKGRTRTADRTIFSRELYQLSYLGKLEVG